MAAFRAAALITREAEVSLNDDPIRDPYSGNTQMAAAMLGYARIDAYYARLAAERAEVKIDALTGALSDDEAKILAAIRAMPTGAQVDVPGLAAALGPVLAPLINAGATPAQVVDAVRRVFASAGQAGGNPT